jgi:hypothetical protein
MIGLIPKLLLEYVATEAGPAAAAGVCETAGLTEHKLLRGGGVCSQQEWNELLEASGRALGVEPEEVARGFARFFLDDFGKRWPVLYQMLSSSRDFIELMPALHQTLSSILISEDDTGNQSIDITTEYAPAESFVVCTCGERPRCYFLLALVEQAIEHWGDRAEVEGSFGIEGGQLVYVVHVHWLENDEHPYLH